MSSPSNPPACVPNPEETSAAVLPDIQKVIDTIPASHLLPPQKNETFANPSQAVQRLQNYAFSAGFVVVIANTRKHLVRYACIHHGTKTANKRKLDPHVGEGSLRVRQHAKTNKLGCRWEVYVSYKSVVRGRGERTWVLGVTHFEHSHPLRLDPLAYPRHKKLFSSRGPLEVMEGSAIEGMCGQSSKKMRLVQEGSEKECDHSVEKDLFGP